MADDKTGNERGTRPSLKETHPHLSGFVDFLPEMNRESDRGRALIACSYLDDLLRRILLAHFVNQDVGPMLVEGFNAPLGSFSTRIVANHALGLISDAEARELNTLRRIRNRFAHEIHVSFETDAVRDLCSNLKMSVQDHDDVKVDARGRFSTASVSLILTLTNRTAYVARKRPSPEQWPY